MCFPCNSQSFGFSSRKGIRQLLTPKSKAPASSTNTWAFHRAKYQFHPGPWKVEDFSHIPFSICNHELLYSSPILLHWHQPDIRQHPAETAPWKACKNYYATFNFSFIGCENCASLPLPEMLSTLCWNGCRMWNSAVTPAAMLRSCRYLEIFCCYSELD